MIPAAFNITYFNSIDTIESFKTKSDSDSDSALDSDSELLDKKYGTNDGTVDIYNIGKTKTKTKTKTNTKKSNKLIGEGTFGCIYDDLNNPDKVHKIFLHSVQYNEELNVSKMLYSTFKNNNIEFPKGLLLPDNILNPDLPNTIKREKLTSGGYKICKLLKDKQNKYNKNSYLYLTYINGGKAINDCLNKFDTIYDLLVSLDNIFNAIADLESISIAHHDIKMPNVLYKTSTNSTILIDYGITSKYKDLFLMNKSNNKNWPRSYFVWPPEFHAIWYIITNKTVPSAIVMHDKVKSVVHISENYVPRFEDMYDKKASMNDFIEFRKVLITNLQFDDTVDHYINNIKNEDVSAYFSNNFANKSDPYGLAILIYAFNKQQNYLQTDGLEKQLVKYLNLNSIDDLSNSQLGFCTNLHEMIRKMGCANPYTRYSSKEANDAYTKLIRKELYNYKNNIVPDNELNNIYTNDYNSESINITEEFIHKYTPFIDISNDDININKHSDYEIKPNIFYIFLLIAIIITVLMLIHIYC